MASKLGHPDTRRLFRPCRPNTPTYSRIVCYHPVPAGRCIDLSDITGWLPSNLGAGAFPSPKIDLAS